MTGKRGASGDDTTDDTLRTETSNEDNNDNTLLKRLWRTKRFSGGLVRLGSEPARCDLQLFPLIHHSLNVRRRAELIGDEDGEGSPLVIDLPDCPGNLEVFTTVGEFCLGLLDEKDISASNVVKLIAASTFLEMESLTLIALKFLEESAFNSWESSLDVLATFEDSDLSNVGEGTLFGKCESALLRKIVVYFYPDMLTSRMSCNVQKLGSVAKLFPPNVAKCFFRSCRKGNFGLFYESISPGYNNHLATHFTVPNSFMGASFETSYYLIELSGQREWTPWIEELPYALPDWSRRSTLVLHLAKSMYLENDINGTDPIFHHSILSWSFVSAVLVQLVELRTSPSENFISATDLDLEIANFQKLVGCGLGEGKHWCSAEEDPSSLLLQQDFVLRTLKKLKFHTLLSIVRQFRESRSNHLHILSIAKIVDACLLQHLEAKMFTVQQALLIYQEFPNDSRSSYADLYHVFEDALRRKALSPQEVLDLTKLLDYQKLSDAVVEKLMADLHFDCDPRLRERFSENQREHQIDQEKSKEELIKLCNEHNVQTANLVKVQQELSVLSADFTKATQDIQLARISFEERQRECQSDQEKSKEELIKLRNEHDVQSADLMKVRQELSVRSADLTRATQDIQLAESKLESLSTVTEENRLAAESILNDVKRDLEDEQEKTTCQICFVRPRDALCLPCRHFLYCFDCLNLHRRRTKTCPTCRGPTTRLLKCIL